MAAPHRPNDANRPARLSLPETVINPSRRIGLADTAPRPASRDWSNVVFSVVFCEEARRAHDLKTAG